MAEDMQQDAIDCATQALEKLLGEENAAGWWWIDGLTIRMMIVEWLMVVELVMNDGSMDDCVGLASYSCFFSTVDPFLHGFKSGWMIRLPSVKADPSWWMTPFCRKKKPAKISILNPNMEVWFRWFCFSIGWFLRFQQCNAPFWFPSLKCLAMILGTQVQYWKGHRCVHQEGVWQDTWKIKFDSDEAIIRWFWSKYEVSLVWFFYISIWNLTLYEYPSGN